MFKEILRNPFTVLHALLITFSMSAWTMLQLSFSRLSREKLDQRLRWWAGSLLRFIKLDYTIHNPHQTTLEKGKPYIIMCNHCSYYDIPLSLMALPGSIRMLAKKELLQIPIWGNAMKMTEFVSIDRFNPRQALKDMNYARKVMENGIILWIAPEGTRSATGELQPFKPGGFRLALQCAATIIPVAIEGSNRVMAARSMVVKRGQHVDIHIGRPIDASQFNKRQRDELAGVVENEIRSMLNPSVQ